LIVEDGRVAGVRFVQKEMHVIAAAPTTLIASGGLAYRETTNPPVATSGFTSATVRALLRDMEFVQFHPTASVFRPFPFRFPKRPRRRSAFDRRCGNRFVDEPRRGNGGAGDL
jgi:succinate dehydrogenase/fumarate reductase flavoprotein subunit